MDNENIYDKLEKNIIKERAYGHITKLIFNNNTEMEIKSDDIVIFVGPNNVGKVKR